MAASVCLLTACSSNDPIGEQPGGEGDNTDHKYVFSVATETSGGTRAEYIWKVDSLSELMSGTISMAGKGIEQINYTAYVPLNNKQLWALYNSDYTESTDGSPQYSLDDKGNFREDGRVASESVFAVGPTDDGKAVTISTSWDGSKSDNLIGIYNPQTVSFEKRVTRNFLMPEGKMDSLSFFPTGVRTCGNRMFVTGLRRAKDGKYLTDSAHVMVFSYPELDSLKTIVDDRTSSIGQYWNNIGAIQTDNGDIYTFSSSSTAAGFPYLPTGGKPSGILRIAKGTDDFDPDYFLDFEHSAAKGKIMAAYNAGGNKVFIDYMPAEDESEDKLWAYFGKKKKAFKLALVDLETKTVTPVSGIPTHYNDSYFGQGSLFYEDGKAYKAFLTDEGTYIYRIDINTLEVTRGAKVESAYVPVITRLNY